MQNILVLPPLQQGAPLLRPPPVIKPLPLGDGGMDPMMDRKVNEKPYRGCCGK